MTARLLTSVETQIKAHVHTKIQISMSQGIFYNDWGKALVSLCRSCHLCLWACASVRERKTDVWSALCIAVAGSHIAAPSQLLRLRSDLRFTRRREHSRLSTAPVSQPWAITLVSLSSKPVKTEEESEEEGNRKSLHTCEGRENWKGGSGLFISVYVPSNVSPV